jgi:hypothetical protein
MGNPRFGGHKKEMTKKAMTKCEQEAREETHKRKYRTNVQT